MTQTIPQPVLDVLRTYCKAEVGNIIPIIEHSIHDIVGGNPVLVSQYAETIVRAVMHEVDPLILNAFVEAMRVSNIKAAQTTPVIAPRNHILLNKPVAQPTSQPTSSSPHSPKRRTGPKPPYWFKVVTSLDTKTINGFGVKGKFVNKDALNDEQQGRIVLCQTKDARTKSVYLHILKTNKGKSATLTTPHGGQGMKVDGVERISTYDNYVDLFHSLEHNCGIPTT